MTRLARRRHVLRACVAASIGAALLAVPAAAHTGSLRLGQDPPPVPTWLVVMTGGGVIGLSFLFAALVTDHDLIREINRRSLPVSPGVVGRRVGRRLVRWAGVLLLAATVAVGLFGPADPQTNAAVVFVWAGWWAGYTASVYLVGNSWPAVNPWRTMAEALPRAGNRRVPDWLGPWPAVVGLLGLVWVEVVTPVASDPRLLALVVVAYTLVTLAGAAVFGAGDWFDRVDPVSRVFRCYGWIAPVRPTASGLELRLPGTGATDPDVRAVAEPTFVVAVLWATTYDGLVSTPAWRVAAAPLVGVGVPPLLVYLATIAVGFVAFLGVYRLGARAARRTGRTYLATGAIADQFATSLLPIAAGYHAAHFVAYVVSLLPVLVVLAANPLAPPASVPVLGVPGWFGALGLLFILVGHVLAIWVAHSVAFGLFAGRLQPLRSQYPFVALMIAYTMTSMWIVIQPAVEVPFLA